MFKTLKVIIVYCITFYALAETYPKIYPFVPFEKEKISDSILKLTEDPDYLINFYDIIDQNLSRHQTKVKPWTSTYWPLNKGLIADPYESSFVGYYFERGFVSWTKNLKTFRARQRGKLSRVNTLNESQLNTLAPSEKYDLLVGDTSFGLTNILWKYMKAWGNRKQYGFKHDIFLVGNEFPHPDGKEEKVDALYIAKEMARKKTYNFTSVEQAFRESYQLQSSLAVKKALDMLKQGEAVSIEAAWPFALKHGKQEAKNYVRERKNNLMAFWEGICHGWATAAGIISRPRKSVSFKLPDGRNLKFYPTDIKALISLLWANSLVQDQKVSDKKTGEYLRGGVINQGLRCHLSNAKLDKWGRPYDHRADPIYGDHSPRCIGVHPGIFHLSLVNLIGKQNRSFILDVKVDEAVDNRPVYKYSMNYFNPYDGNFYHKLEDNVVLANKKDQFHKFRNQQTKYLVGVQTSIRYLDWTRPKRYPTDKEAFDRSELRKVLYDLELDQDFNIIGGQWRVVKVGTPRRRSAHRRGAGPKTKLKHDWPDFLWVITKHWKQQFKEKKNLAPWIDRTQAPPKSWFAAVKKERDFMYQERYIYGTGQKCKHIHRKTGKTLKVSCEFEIPRPQPLINIVNELIKRSQ